MIDFEYEFWWLKTVEDFPKSWRWWSTSGFSLFFSGICHYFSGWSPKEFPGGKSPVHVARRILRHAKIMAADYESGLDMELYEVQMAKLVIYKWQWLSVYNINSVYIYIFVCSYLNCLWVVIMLFLFILAIYTYIISYW